MDKHYKTNPYGVIVCTTSLTTLDPTIRIPAFEILILTTKMYLKFLISNGEFHSTNEILCDSLKCTVNHHLTDNSHSYDTDESLCTSVSQAHSTSCQTNKFFVSMTCSKTHKINEMVTTLWKPKVLKSVNKIKTWGKGMLWLWRSFS